MSHISNTTLLTLPKDVVSMLEEGTLTGQARPLIGISNVHLLQKKLFLKIIAQEK